MNAKQIVVIVLVVVLMGALLAQPIKGLVDKKDDAATAGKASTAGSSSRYNLKTVSELAKQSLNNTSLIQDISAIEAQVEKADGDEKLKLLQQLADKWSDVAKDIPQGFIYEDMAKLSPKASYWLKSGDAYRAGYTNLQDTAMVSALNKLAINAYEQVLKLEPNNLPAKTGLGSAMVTGTSNPMAGIAFLREVIAAEPKNIEANKALGLFSLQSQQFDKAIDRFKTVVEQKPDAESYFYLATGYEKIGLKDEAIVAYKKSKELAADPTLSQYIDRQIDELSKK